MGWFSAGKASRDDVSHGLSEAASGCHAVSASDITRQIPACDRGGMLLSDGVEGRVRLPARDAIANFVSWLQRRGDTGLTRSKRLIALYSIHCDELNLAELSSNIMLQELRKVAPRSEERVPRTDRYRQ